jgi:hypothetical protein
MLYREIEVKLKRLKYHKNTITLRCHEVHRYAFTRNQFFFFSGSYSRPDMETTVSKSSATVSTYFLSTSTDHTSSNAR